MQYITVVAIRSFDVSGIKGLAKAQASGLPDLVAISGANGSGKSTLLNELFQRGASYAETGTKVMYLGPSRPQRRSQVSGASLFSFNSGLLETLSSMSIPGFQNFVPSGFQNVANGGRLNDSVDESFIFVKHEISRLEVLRREGLAQIFDVNGGHIPAGVVPDVFAPLRRLTEFLIPHLVFGEINQVDPSNYRCLFRRSGLNSDVEVDIDDLSSGEKAVIALFMPFISLQVRSALAKCGVSLPVAEQYESLTMIIDEPEIHLHPALQASLVAYLRQLIKESNVQFILATHSPSILDELTPDELFMLSPTVMSLGGNQFRQLSTSDERLGLIREIAGSASAITRARPIVFVEGEPAEKKIDSDRSLLGQLVPASRTWVVVPASGQSQALRSAEQLAGALVEDLPGLPVFSLVDSDQGIVATNERVVPWPVAMVENLLLDEEVIFNLLEPHSTLTSFTTVESVRDALALIADSQKENEIRLRLRRAFAPHRVIPAFKIESPIDAQIRALREELDAYFNELAEERVNAEIAEARRAVQGICDQGLQLEKFHGKNILAEFYRLHVGGRSLSRAGFLVELARSSRGSSRLARLTDPAVRHISNYIPSRVAVLLKERPDGVDVQEWSETERQAQAAIAFWRGPNGSDPVDLSLLRSKLLKCLGAYQDGGMSPQAGELGTCLSMIGLGQ